MNDNRGRGFTRAVIHLEAPRRTLDDWGAGHWGAPRGQRIHSGIDFAAWPGSLVRSPVAGQVTKLGYPYADDQTFRYVEVTDDINCRHRFFYVEPEVSYGFNVAVGTILGRVQDLRERYAMEVNELNLIKGAITPHLHYEIMLPDNHRIDPDEWWQARLTDD